MRRTLFSFFVVMVWYGFPRRAPARICHHGHVRPPDPDHACGIFQPLQTAQASQLPKPAGKIPGPRLQQLESTLDQIGVREDDIDELMIGWKPGDKEMDLYGYASGHFDKAQVASRAAAQNLTPTPISGQQAYCLSAGVTGTCVVILENSLGAFGPLSSLTTLLEAHEGQSPNLNSDSRFTSLVGDVNKDAPIWGIALGGAVADWFGGWLSSTEHFEVGLGTGFPESGFPDLHDRYS